MTIPGLFQVSNKNSVMGSGGEASRTTLVEEWVEECILPIIHSSTSSQSGPLRLQFPRSPVRPHADTPTPLPLWVRLRRAMLFVSLW
jgi:hypothetical protein